MNRTLTGAGGIQNVTLSGIVGRAFSFTGVADFADVHSGMTTGSPIGLLLALTYTVST